MAYFTITVDGSDVVTFAAHAQCLARDVGNHDDPQTLTPSGRALQLLTVTDADGDIDSAALNLGAVCSPSRTMVRLPPVIAAAARLFWTRRVR